VLCYVRPHLVKVEVHQDLSSLHLYYGASHLELSRPFRLVGETEITNYFGLAYIYKSLAMMGTLNFDSMAFRLYYSVTVKSHVGLVFVAFEQG